jgi:hypothetical protein
MSNVTVEGVKRKYGIKFDAYTKKLIDDFMSDDPLTDLAAVMRHHKLRFTGGIDSYVIIQQGSDLDVIFSEQFITADDIKPEQ